MEWRKIVLNRSGTSKWENKCRLQHTTHRSLCSSISCHGHHVLRHPATSCLNTAHNWRGKKQEEERGDEMHTHTHLAATNRQRYEGVYSFLQWADKREKACTQLVQEGCTDANIY